MQHRLRDKLHKVTKEHRADSFYSVHASHLAARDLTPAPFHKSKKHVVEQLHIRSAHKWANTEGEHHERSHLLFALICVCVCLSLLYQQISIYDMFHLSPKHQSTCWLRNTEHHTHSVHEYMQLPESVKFVLAGGLSHFRDNTGSQWKK